MRRLNNLYQDMCNLDNIIDMTEKVLKNTTNKHKVDNFELYKMEYVINIKKRLDERNFNFCRYSIFMITDPKYRIIMDMNMEDKIINHLVSKYILNRVFENKYTDGMVAARIGRGTSYGIKLLKKYLNKLKNDNFYVLKLDIKKYFYNIDHSILKRILKDNIKDKDALSILFKVIDSTNESYINERIIKLKGRRINHLSNEKLISETRDIPLYEYNKGCGIGDQTSQAFGLIYLNEICHFIKEDLHIKYFINYMDDFVIIHEDKKYLEYCLNTIRDKLYNEYKLELNRKTRIYNIKEGIEFLGFRFINKDRIIMKLSNKTKKRFVRKMKNLNSNKELNVISSYMGHLKYGD